jgi:hypothetical protein
MSSAYIKDPAEHFRLGQVVNPAYQAYLSRLNNTEYGRYELMDLARLVQSNKGQLFLSNKLGHNTAKPKMHYRRHS